MRAASFNHRDRCQIIKTLLKINGITITLAAHDLGIDMALMSRIANGVCIPKDPERRGAISRYLGQPESLIFPELNRVENKNHQRDLSSGERNSTEEEV